MILLLYHVNDTMTLGLGLVLFSPRSLWVSLFPAPSFSLCVSLRFWWEDSRDEGQLKGVRSSSHCNRGRKQTKGSRWETANSCAVSITRQEMGEDEAGPGWVWWHAEEWMPPHLPQECGPGKDDVRLAWRTSLRQRCGGWLKTIIRQRRLPYGASHKVTEWERPAERQCSFRGGQNRLTWLFHGSGEGRAEAQFSWMCGEMMSCLQLALTIQEEWQQ